MCVTNASQRDMLQKHVRPLERKYVLGVPHHTILVEIVPIKTTDGNIDVLDVVSWERTTSTLLSQAGARGLIHEEKIF